MGEMVAVGAGGTDGDGSRVGVVTGAAHPTRNVIANAIPINCWSDFMAFIFTPFVPEH
jgi:hypothetical protein